MTQQYEPSQNCEPCCAASLVENMLGLLCIWTILLTFNLLLNLNPLVIYTTVLLC